MNKSYFLEIALLPMLLIGCGKQDLIGYGEEGLIEYEKEGVYENVQLIEELNSKAAKTLIIGENTFVLKAYLWRDFMPSPDLDRDAMISINRLTDINSVKIPDNIRMIQQYVIYGNSIWIANYEKEERPSQPAYIIEEISRNGPKWGPKIYVDVVSKVYDTNTNKIYYIKCKNAYIDRTD